MGCNRLGAYGSYTNKINSTIKTCPLFFSSQNEQHTLYHKTFCFPDLFFLKFLQKALWVQGQTAFHGPPQVNPFHHTLVSFHNVQYYRTILSKQVFVGYKLQLNNNYAFQMTPEFTVSTRDCVRGSGRGWRNNNNKE